MASTSTNSAPVLRALQQPVDTSTLKVVATASWMKAESMPETHQTSTPRPTVRPAPIYSPAAVTLAVGRRPFALRCGRLRHHRPREARLLRCGPWRRWPRRLRRNPTQRHRVESSVHRRSEATRPPAHGDPRPSFLLNRERYRLSRRGATCCARPPALRGDHRGGTHPHNGRYCVSGRDSSHPGAIPAAAAILMQTKNLPHSPLPLGEGPRGDGCP